jgi:hypothetical protein
VGDERGGDAFLGLLSELLILVSGDRCFIHPGRAVGVEGAQPGSVGFAAALRGEAVRRVHQPKRRPNPLGSTGQTEQSTHPRSPFRK